MLSRADERGKIWDIIVIGGGATGIGCAVDAASRGYDVLLLEQSDFGKGTSSRSTKLVHGGVRYLAQGNVSLVRESLRERGILARNAPHLVRKLPFIVPVYSYWDKFFYGAGLKTYNLLSGKLGFGKSELLSRDETIDALPNVRRDKLQGGISYFDGQFDDARLLIDLAKTATENGAAVLNYARVFSFVRERGGRINGVAFSDEISGMVFSVRAKAVINATGAFCDALRKTSDKKAKNLIAASQGIHLVFDRSFLPSESALMVPKTSDDRVLFAIPWHGHALVGTTDTPVATPTLEPEPRDDEIDFILETAAEYLEKAPTRADILSVFTGIRPLVRSDSQQNTAAISRDHTIEVDRHGLVTITGGKWTTYRRMAKDAIDTAAKLAGLGLRKCVTATLRIHGGDLAETVDPNLAIYGSDAGRIESIIGSDQTAGEPIHPLISHSRAELIHAIRNEMCETVEDFLARRTRVLFLDAKAAIEAAPAVAAILASELQKENPEFWISEQIRQFREIAARYLVKS